MTIEAPGLAYTILGLWLGVPLFITVSLVGTFAALTVTGRGVVAAFR